MQAAGPFWESPQIGCLDIEYHGTIPYGLDHLPAKAPHVFVIVNHTSHLTIKLRIAVEAIDYNVGAFFNFWPVTGLTVAVVTPDWVGAHRLFKHPRRRPQRTGQTKTQEAPYEGLYLDEPPHAPYCTPCCSAAPKYKVSSLSLPSCAYDS